MTHSLMILTVVASVLLVGRTTGLQTTSATLVKRELLASVVAGSAEGLAQQVLILEDAFVPIQTKAFFDVAVGGEWLLQYSDGPKRADSDVELSVYQVIKPEEGTIDNEVVSSALSVSLSPCPSCPM
jgi:hypothetical protein